MNLLEVKNLKVIDKEDKKEIVKGVSFKVEKNMCLGIVGESGSGKSMTAKAIVGLISSNLKIEGYAVFDENIDLFNIKKDKLRKIRGQRICMILQDAMSAFDPLYTVGYQMIETLVENKNLSKKKLRVMQIGFALVFLIFIIFLILPKNYTKIYNVDNIEVTEKYNKKNKVYYFTFKK